MHDSSGVCVICEHRFSGRVDGTVWTRSSYAYSFWCRYHSVFDHVKVAARVGPSSDGTDRLVRADGTGVTFAPVPLYVGVAEYLRVAGRVRTAMRRAFRWGDAVVIRAFSPLSHHVDRTLFALGYPYAVELVGDPAETFAPGAVRHPLRPLLRWWFPRLLRRQCSRACAVAYVTRHHLQRRYPASAGAFTTHYSSIELNDADFAATPREFPAPLAALRLVFVGSLAQRYKRLDVLLDAISMRQRDGADLRLTIVGDGRHRQELEARAAQLDLAERVAFVGEVPAGEPVRQFLRAADLYVLPSQTEGLPRAMVEAMALGLPCIGSAVGGIQEILDADDLVPPGDARALARKLRELAAAPQRLERMSARNLARAREFREDTLTPRRDELYRHVRERTRAWVRERARP